MYYTIEKSRFYAADEPYNSGAGLSVTTQNLEEADRHWDAMCSEDFTKWSVVFRVNDTVTREWGVSRRVAIESMHAAYRRRFGRDASAG